MRSSATPFALLLSLLAAGCGGGLYTAEGLPPLDGGGNTCDPFTQLECPGSAACVTRDVAQCEACGTPCPAVANGQATCSSPNDLTTPRACGRVCNDGFMNAGAGCERVLAVAAGGDHTCAVTEGGTLRCWGENDAGQVTRTSTSAAEPLPVTVFAQGAGLVLAAGTKHTYAVVSGQVQCWGSNGSGRATPPALAGTVTGLAAGDAHTCAIAGGTVTCWGDNGLGQTAFTLTGLTPAARIVAGLNHTCVLAADGAVRCWGDNGKSQLGPGPGTPFAAGSGLVSIAAGHEHTCVADGATDGVTCWGANPGGVVLPALLDPTPPAMPLKGNGDPIVGKKPAGLLAAGRAHTCAVLLPAPPENPGCFGDNAFGQLGGATPPAPELVLISGVTSDLLALSSGADHTCARLSDSSLKCWGRNDKGQLGIGNTTTPATPGAAFVSGR